MKLNYHLKFILYRVDLGSCRILFIDEFKKIGLLFIYRNKILNYTDANRIYWIYI